MTKPLLLQLLLAAGFLIAIIAGTAQGQETGGNPHGPLRVGCETCHSPEGWRPLRKPLPFDHGKETGFPLVKSHREVACLGCHQDLRFQRVATACVDCHRDPHRGELGLSCESCHSPHGWDSRRQVFEIHNASLFPLTGAHTALDCGSCHRGSPPNEFRGTPRDCFSCHAEDYRRAQPDHVRSGFPTQCETCHTTSDFSDADFRAHDARFFPIFSGVHRGVWDSCSSCHTSVNQGNFQNFTCLTCHEHRRSEMDDEHDDVRAYRYESNACLSCHPQGRE
ncbi:MAG TPA: hypothetical protein VN493_15315 [Thermoanaerobaculia bacterium]|nr:hypothetical protein [Thermoanaerobaculia bacterium]